MTTNYEILEKEIAKIHKYRKQKQLIGIKVKPFVLDILKKQSAPQYRVDIPLLEKFMGLDVYVDEKADYPFTPIYNQQEAK